MMVTPKITKIKEQRISQGLSMSGLSKKAGLSVSSTLRIERGVTKKVIDLRAQAIADALGCPVEELFEVPSAAQDAVHKKASA